MAGTGGRGPFGGRVVTLLTDFGLQDPYVGILKGVLLTRAPSLRAIVDLTHDVPAQDLRRAAFFLRHAFGWFPAGTVHLVVVDPGVGSARALVAIAAAGRMVVAPDNGLLGPLLQRLEREHTAVRAWRLEVERVGAAGTSRTFHGRDRFAPLAAALAEGSHPDELGEPLEAETLERLSLPGAVATEDGLQGSVLFADRFGNLVTTIDEGALAARFGPDWGRRTRIEVRGGEAGGGAPLRVRLCGSYVEARPGELLALADSYGHLEVARRDGSAVEALAAAGVKLCPTVAVRVVPRGPASEGSDRRPDPEVTQ